MVGRLPSVYPRASRRAIAEDRYTALVRALILQAGGEVKIPPGAMEVAGVVTSEPTGDGGLTFRVSCQDGHTPDSPAAGRDIYCRVCGGILVDGGRP